MEAIVAVDQNWAIGLRGKLLQPIAEDLKHFRRLSRDRILIYGSGTLSSFPSARPLPKRPNWILSRRLRPEDLGWASADDPNGLRIFRDLSSLEKAVQDSGEPGRRFLVIGGASVYRLLLPYCDCVHLTRIDHAFEASDAGFPNLDADPEWELAETEAPQTDDASGLNFAFLTYRRICGGMEL